MFRRKDREAQASLWLPTQELPRTAATSRQALAGSHGLVFALLPAILGIVRLLGTRWTRHVTQHHPLPLAAA